MKAAAISAIDLVDFWVNFWQPLGRSWGGTASLVSRTFRSVLLVARVYFLRRPETSDGFWRWPTASVQNWFAFCIISGIIILCSWTLNCFCCRWWYTAFRMGSHLVRSYITERDAAPDPQKPSAYDPNLGFAERKERGDIKPLKYT